MVKKYLLTATLAAFVFSGCEYKPKAVGRAREVYIFTDHKDEIGFDISLSMERQILTPQPGVEFFLEYRRGYEVTEHLRRHSLLIAGYEQDSAIRFMKNLYSALTCNDSFNLYTFKDLWAEGQTVMVFVAEDSLWMRVGLSAVRSNLHSGFKNMLLERMEGVTYGGGDDRKLTGEIEKYGFKLRIPEKWYLDERYAEDNFIWVHSYAPDRLVFIYWEDEEREDITRESILNLRDSLAHRFYEGDSLYRPLTTAGPYFFRGYQAVRIEGVWQNDSLVSDGRVITGGGPMIGFAFNAEGRFWMIDAMLFYPETPRKKIFWLNQLEVILATFEPV